MGQKHLSIQPDTLAAELRTFRMPKRGQILLACGKCQRKLKHGEHGAAAKLKKTLRTIARHDDDPIRLVVLKVSCLKLCPKDAVTVCTAAQVARSTCSIVRTRAEIESLYRQCKTGATPVSSGHDS